MEMNSSLQELLIYMNGCYRNDIQDREHKYSSTHSMQKNFMLTTIVQCSNYVGYRDLTCNAQIRKRMSPNFARESQNVPPIAIIQSSVSCP